MRPTMTTMADMTDDLSIVTEPSAPKFTSGILSVVPVDVLPPLVVGPLLLSVLGFGGKHGNPPKIVQGENPVKSGMGGNGNVPLLIVASDAGLLHPGDQPSE
jgi:hypothetical protein